MHPKRAACSLSALVLAISCALPLSAADDPALAKALAAVRTIAPQGAGHQAAVAAAKTASQAPGSKLPQILAAMDGVNPVAENWLRGVAEAVAQKTTAAGQKLPVKELEAFLADGKHSPRGRRLAYELIAAVDPSAEARLIPTLLDDSSTELRRDAVAQAIAAAEKITDKPQAISAWQKAFHHARDLDQIKATAAKLTELEKKPDIATHMGYLMTWKLIGPFDNVGDKGWDVAYPPEAKVDLAAEYEGQKGPVKWTEHTTTDDYGTVDLNKVQGNHKGAITYAYAELVADRDRPCELRLGCINANKIWLNGELLTANHVYHAGSEIDQYIAPGTLKKGKNAILLKICQNEQTENWAQGWQFQLRVCDAVGTAILSQDRPTAKVARAERPRLTR
jgi:hypothetical protein